MPINFDNKKAKFMTHNVKPIVTVKFARANKLAEKVSNETIDRWKEVEAGQVVDNGSVLSWLKDWGKNNEKDSI